MYWFIICKAIFGICCFTHCNHGLKSDRCRTDVCFTRLWHFNTDLLLNYCQWNLTLFHISYHAFNLKSLSLSLSLSRYLHLSSPMTSYCKGISTQTGQDTQQDESLPVCHGDAPLLTPHDELHSKSLRCPQLNWHTWNSLHHPADTHTQVRFLIRYKEWVGLSITNARALPVQ